MSSERDGRSDRPVKAGSRTTGMHGVEKSDGPVVPTKPPNETRRDPRRVEEVVEGRGPTSGNTDEQNTSRTQGRGVVSSALDRVREAAKKDKKTKFTALLHHATIDRLRAAYRSLKKDAAPGVDGVTWTQYGQQLEE